MTNENRRLEYRLLFLISSQRLAPKALEIFSRQRVPMQYHVHAKGTASGEFAEMIGLGGSDKVVLLGMLTKHVADEMLLELQTQLYLGTPNSGIAFTVPISGGSASVTRLMQVLQEEHEQEHMDTERIQGDYMDNNYTLILAFVNQGCSEEVMSAARPAGAGGGTVFHSRSVSNEEVQKLWGISVQPEREIVMIVAEREKKLAIMKAISEKCGSQSPAKGMMISLPIDGVAGLKRTLL